MKQISKCEVNQSDVPALWNFNLNIQQEIIVLEKRFVAFMYSLIQQFNDRPSSNKIDTYQGKESSKNFEEQNQRKSRK